MIPDFSDGGVLPSGIHLATWDEFNVRFGFNQHRKNLIGGLKTALDSLKSAGCTTVYIDGSFVTDKEIPKDFDGCWDPTNVDPSLLDPVLLDFKLGRINQKTKFGGELFVSSARNGNPGPVMLDFFQYDRNGNRKGIVAIDLRRLL